jgi:hypothetical protein
MGTQETSCILIAGLLERDIFDLFLPEFDKPWVIHLREICCCSTNLCTWRSNTIYKNRSIRRHHLLGKRANTFCARWRGRVAAMFWPELGNHRRRKNGIGRVRIVIESHPGKIFRRRGAAMGAAAEG